MAEKKATVFHKETFDKTSEARRQKIYDVAVAAFAANGYTATKINDIARQSGISIGAMYSYFASKEDLFLTIVNKGFEVLDTIISGARSEEDDIYVTYEKLLYAARDFALTYPELNQIYLDMTTQGLAFMSGRLSKQVEQISVDLYREVIQRTKQKGLMCRDINDDIIIFSLDSLVIMFLFSFASDYYRERLRLFLGEELAGDSDTIIENIMKLVRKALA